MELTGDDAETFLREVRAEARRVQAGQLATAKADAVARGKEPFDLAVLETLCDTSSSGRVDPVAARQERFERMYYVHHPELLTLAALAEKVTELNRWS